MTFQVCQPMVYAKQKQVRAWPVARSYKESKQGADGCFTAADSAEMGVRTGGHNATAHGTAVALHVI